MIITRLLESYKKQDILHRLGLTMIVVGLFTMEFFHLLANYGLVLLCLLGIWQMFQQKISIKSLFTDHLFTPFLIVFLLFLISLLFTAPQNYDELQHQIEKRLWLLGLPFAMIALPRFSEKWYDDLFILFFSIIIATAAYSTVEFYIHKETLIYEYKRSGVIPTPVNHIRYSLMVCYAIFIGIYLLFKNRFNVRSGKNIFLLTGVIFLIFYLHLLAVRSGLLSFYCVSFIVMIYFFVKRNYTALLTLTAAIITLILFAFEYIETIQVKWSYTIHDLYVSSDKEERGNDYSIARRLVSNKITFDIFKKHPIVGTGEGNLSKAMEKVYREEYPYIRPENYLSPHNQYLRILAGVGIVGFLIFFSCFYYPLFHNKNYRYFPLIAIYIIISISFLVEDTLQTQLGYTFALFFILINLHFLKQKPNPAV